MSVHALAVGEVPGLRADDADVEPAQDLLGALARLADGGVDIVLLSLDLPDAPGFEAIRSIRERAVDVPIIAFASEAEATRALDAGASDVLPPDASPGLVERAVRYATSMQRLEAELHRRQVVDDTTGLYNARGLEQLAAHHLALSNRTKEPVVFVFVHMDRLEVSEATEAERSALVSRTAAVLRRAVRESDVVARIGSGAFCVLLTGDASGSESIVLSRLVEAVAQNNAREGETGQLSISVAAAAYDPENPVPLGDLIRQAGQRMQRPGEAAR